MVDVPGMGVLMVHGVMPVYVGMIIVSRDPVIMRMEFIGMVVGMLMLHCHVVMEMGMLLRCKKEYPEKQEPEGKEDLQVRDLVEDDEGDRCADEGAVLK